MAVRIHGTFGSWLLPQGESVLGRGSEAGVRIDDPRLSRKHATFIVTGHRLEVEDLGSRNGVLVDGLRITRRRDVAHGQVVVCGPAVLMISIDQTQPHPRLPEGQQDPTTRRTTAKPDTETMLEPVTDADKPASSGRGIDPAILAAVSSGSGRTAMPDAARQSALQPAAAPGSITSPLEAIRPSPKPPSQRRAPTTSTSLLAPEAQSSTSGALEAPARLMAGGRVRVLAALLDAGVALIPALGGAVVLLVSIVLALHVAGAGLVHGLVRVGAPVEAGFADLLAACLTPEGLVAGIEQARAVAIATPAVAGAVIGGAAIAAMLAASGLLFLLVVPTVERGAPWGHRRYGLLIARSDGSGSPGYGRSLLRWLLAAAFWPLAIPCLLAGMRSPHDVLSGCLVRVGTGFGFRVSGFGASHPTH